MYKQFYDMILKQPVEEPIKHFNLFIDEVVNISSIYHSCIQNSNNNLDNAYIIYLSGITENKEDPA